MYDNSKTNNQDLSSVTCAELPHLPVLSRIEQAFDGGYWHFHPAPQGGDAIPCCGNMTASFETVPNDPTIAKCARCSFTCELGAFPVDFPGYPHLQLSTADQDLYGCSGAPPGKGLCYHCRQDESDERWGFSVKEFGIDVIQ